MTVPDSSSQRNETILDSEYSFRLRERIDAMVKFAVERVDELEKERDEETKRATELERQVEELRTQKDEEKQRADESELQVEKLKCQAEKMRGLLLKRNAGSK